MCAWPGTCRLQAAAREARKEYEALGAKDLSQLKTFVKVSILRADNHIPV